MTRALRIVKVLLIGLLVLATALVCVGLWCANTEKGRRMMADRIAAAVTNEIPGRLEIGEIKQVSWLWLRAEDVRFFHPDGRCVLHVEHAMVEPDALDALRGRLSFKRVAADGGSIVMGGDPDGRLSLEAAMDRPKQPSAGPSDPKGGLHYDMRNMRVKNFNIVVPESGIGKLRVSNVTGLVHVWRLDTPGTRVRLSDIAGKVSPEIAGVKLAVKQLDAIITGAEAVVAKVETRLTVDGDSALSLRLRYAPKGKEKVSVHVVDKEGTEATTLTWLVHAAASFSKDIAVEG